MSEKYRIQPNLIFWTFSSTNCAMSGVYFPEFDKDTNYTIILFFIWRKLNFDNRQPDLTVTACSLLVLFLAQILHARCGVSAKYNCPSLAGKGWTKKSKTCHEMNFLTSLAFSGQCHGIMCGDDWILFMTCVHRLIKISQPIKIYDCNVSITVSIMCVLIQY